MIAKLPSKINELKQNLVVIDISIVFCVCHEVCLQFSHTTPRWSWGVGVVCGKTVCIFPDIHTKSIYTCICILYLMYVLRIMRNIERNTKDIGTNFCRQQYKLTFMNIITVKVCIGTRLSFLESWMFSKVDRSTQKLNLSVHNSSLEVIQSLIRQIMWSWPEKHLIDCYCKSRS